MDEIRLNQEAAKGARAKALLENELLVGAFAELESAYIERWRLTHIDDDKGREKLFIAVNVVGKVRDHLSAIVSNGSMAAKQLDDLAKQAERKKILGVL
jgi:hypothetical protein